MMTTQQPAAADASSIQQFVTTLLEQGCRCRELGLVAEARSILAEAWSISRSVALAITDEVAWEIAWTCLEAGDDAAAGEWFARVRQLATPRHSHWPQLQAMLVAYLMDASAASDVHARQAGPPATDAPVLPPLEIITFGSFQVWRGGRRLSGCRSRKSVAIFRYLLTRDRWTASREELIEQFWPAATSADGTHSLHAAVSLLRRYLDPPNGSYILFEAGYYLVNPAATLLVDSCTFREQLAAAERLLRVGDSSGAERALDVAVATYVADYHIDELDPLWAITEREHLAASYLTALNRLGSLYEQRGAVESAITCFQQIVARDVYREDIHARLMQCYLKLGRRNDALRQYDICARVLADDLGLVPGEELRLLSAAAVHTGPGGSG